VPPAERRAIHRCVKSCKNLWGGAAA